MKKLFTLLTMLVLGIGSMWAGYIPTKRVTTFESGKVYMLYNTCVTSSDTRTGFIYWDGSMKKNTSFNPHQFATNNTAYLWRVTTGENNHIALQNVSTSKYIGFRLGANDTDPNNLYLYPWGTNQSKQSDAKSQNEADPNTSTENANITFETNKVFIIGNPSSGETNNMWNGNPGDIVLWSNGHPFAFYEVEEVEGVFAEGSAYKWNQYSFSTPSEVPQGAESATGVNQGYLRFDATGSVTCTFLYSNGNHRLDIYGVDVLDADGNVIASDYHHGYTGGSRENNVYTLNIPDGKAGTHLVRYFVGKPSNTTNGTITWSCNTAFGAKISSGKTATIEDNVHLLYSSVRNFTGTGNIVLNKDETISNNVITTGTGKLIINEGKTLTIGSGDKQTNSIESFSSIELAGMIKHQNSKATLNNVTVPTGKTGKIFAYDMGSEDDGFKLAGTTTLVGNLTVCSKWNFQMKVEELAGSGTWLICGTTGNDFDDTKTTSDEDAIVKVGSSPDFTGTIHEANTKSKLSIIGTLKNCTLKGTQAPDGYPQLADGAVLDGVVLEGDKRIGTIGNVTIKDLAGNNLSGTSNNYAFIGSGTLNFEGTCDLTKKSDGTTASTCSKIGYPSGNNIVIKTGATVTASDIYNAGGNNAAITVEGTMSATYFGGVATLAEGSNTTLSDGTPFDGAVTVSGNATLNLTNATSTLNRAITVAEGKTLTINGGSNTVNLTGGISGAGNIVLSYFPTAATHPTLTDWTGSIEFPSIATAQGDLAAIFNAWGNENSTIKLNSVAGWLPGLATGKEYTVYPTLDILENQTLTINNGSSNTTPVLKKITGAGNLEQTWSSGSNYTLKIATLTDFTGTLKGTKKTIVVDKLVVADAPDADDLLIKTSGTVTLNKLYIGLQLTEAYLWDTKTVGEVTGIYVTSVDLVQLARESAVNTVAPYYNFIGTGVGKYTISLGYDKYNSIDDFLAALDAWSTVYDYKVPIVTLNQPTSAFYRIKSGDKYLQDARKSDSDTQRTLTDAAGANESAETIFYLDNNKFIGYKTGYGFGFSVCQTQDTEHLNTQLFTESAEMGKYTIQSQQGTCSEPAYNEGFWGVDGSELSRKDDAASGACWKLEPATSVPVTFKKAGLGYATLYTPVALQIPENTNAYVCKLQESGSNAYTLTFYEITAIKDESNHTTIPANTAVLLYRSGVKDGEEDVVVNFPITTCKDEEGEDVVITENSFYGTLATEDFDPNSTEEDIYSLRTYLRDDQAVKVGFYKKTTGTTCAGFKAWIKTDHPVNDEVRNIIISFDGVDDPTGIVEALGLENANVEIYDLNGRKMATYKKGINIVNGKKVLVK